MQITRKMGIFQNDPMMKVTPQKTSVSNPNTGQETKIPFNYRFQKDFEFRWDGSSQLSIPRKKMAGYEYFKHMIKQIEEGFAAPGGGNIAYRDQAGFFIREGISPGETKVSFMLNDAGQVIDVKQVTSQGNFTPFSSKHLLMRGNAIRFSFKLLIFGIE
jgi:hypothetical protein